MMRLSFIGRWVTRVAFLVAAACVCSCGGGTPSAPTGAPAATNTGIAQVDGGSAATGIMTWSCFTAGRAAAFGAADCTPRGLLPQTTLRAAALPATPSGLSQSVTGTTVALTWQIPPGGEAPASYIVEAGSASGLNDLARLDTGNTQTTLTVTSVPAGTYYVRVRARNSSGTSAASNEVVVSIGGTPCTTAPSAPIGLTGSVSGSTVSLAWTAPAGCSITTYRLDAGTTSGSSNVVTLLTGSAATTFAAANVPGGTYFIRVRAQNTGGTSTPSNEISVTVASSSPPTITVGAYPLALGTNDASMHGITIAIDGQPVTTTFRFPGFAAAHPQFQGPLPIGDHQVVISMSSWDSLIFNVGSSPADNGGSVDSGSFTLISNNWNRTPLSTRVACSGRVLFQGQATGSITFRFTVIPGVSAASCPAPTTTG